MVIYARLPKLFSADRTDTRIYFYTVGTLHFFCLKKKMTAGGQSDQPGRNERPE